MLDLKSYKVCIMTRRLDQPSASCMALAFTARRRDLLSQGVNFASILVQWGGLILIWLSGGGGGLINFHRRHWLQHWPFIGEVIPNFGVMVVWRRRPFLSWSTINLCRTFQVPPISDVELTVWLHYIRPSAQWLEYFRFPPCLLVQLKGLHPNNVIFLKVR